MNGELKLVVSSPNPTVTTVQVPGLPGPKGEAGDETSLTMLSGEAFAFTNPAENDVIQYKGGRFVNRSQSNLVDGGNF